MKTLEYIWILISALWSARSRRFVKHVCNLVGIIWSYTKIDPQVPDAKIEELFNHYFNYRVLEDDKPYVRRLLFEKPYTS